MRWTIGAACLLALGAATPADAAAPFQPRPVVDQVIALIGANYVFPEKRAGIVAKLKDDEAQGRYDVASAAELVDRLGADMSAAGHDRHLWIQYDPDQNKALRTAGNGDENAFFERQAALRNMGYEELRILPGNIRYVNLTGFMWRKDGARIVADSARFLSEGDAVIVDLRQNGGGSAQAVQNLVSYFLPPDNRALMYFHKGANGAAKPTRVLTRLAAPRMVGKPLYVLISGSTGSAAEEFAYHVEQFHLGTLVGHATAGAANNDTLYPVGDGFIVSVSTDRPEHPVSHTNWEGTGVPPDVAVADDQALAQAQLLALKALAARPGAKADAYDWAIAGLEAHMHPVTVDPATQASYAGIYGDRTIRLQDGKLIFQRAGRDPTTLSPLSPDLFEFGNSAHVRLRFRREAGRVTGFDMITDDGQTIAVPRSP